MVIRGEARFGGLVSREAAKDAKVGVGGLASREDAKMRRWG